MVDFFGFNRLCLKEKPLSILYQVDGKTSHTPASPSPGVKIYERHHRIYLKTDFGLTVRFDGDDEAGKMTSTYGNEWEVLHINNFYGLISFLQRSLYHACTEGRSGACAATMMDKVEMTGWSQMVAQPGARRSLWRAGKCKFHLRVRKRIMVHDK